MNYSYTLLLNRDLTEAESAYLSEHLPGIVTGRHRGAAFIGGAGDVAKVQNEGRALHTYLSPRGVVIVRDEVYAISDDTSAYATGASITA